MRDLLQMIKRIFHKQSRSSLDRINLSDRDVFLVSYPRSGNTWVRFLFANLLKDTDEEIHFQNVHQYVPELGRNEKIIQDLAFPRIIKTHSVFKEAFPRVIYLVRDGRDVYVSYYHYKKNQFSEINFENFLRRNDHFPCLWHEHVESWLFNPNVKTDIITIKYESLLENTHLELKRMVDFVDLKCSKNEINLAVQASSFEKMKEVSRRFGRKYKPTGAKNFVRKGIHGDWRDYFSESDKKYFKKRTGDCLIKLGYEKDGNW